LDAAIFAKLGSVATWRGYICPGWYGMSSMSAVVERKALKFSTEGLPAREELVFKSLVRLLAGRTQHVWRYSPQAAELHVLAEGLSNTSAPANPKSHQQVLILGEVSQSIRPGYLCIPIRAIELEDELNRIGKLLASATPVESPQLVALRTSKTPSYDVPVRLLRWPPAHLIAAPGRIRLATLLTGKAMTLTALHQKSGQDMAVCRQFLSAMHAAMLLIYSENTDVVAPTLRASLPQLKRAYVAPVGLLARIRARLGVQRDVGE
jgi:hypothetical protein